MNAKIEELKQEDLKKIQDFSEFDDFWTMEILKKDLEQKESCYFKATLQEEIVGIIGFKKIMDVLEIMNIAVKKTKRRQGIGKQLLEFLLEKLKRDPAIQKIELEVNEKNEGARKLYEICGFQIVGRRKKYYNNQEDAILMNFEK